jgi:hypothetical protein
MTATAAWPESVITRYLTVAGAALADRTITVDLFGPQRDGGDLYAVCRGCGYSWSHNYEPEIRQWAQGHAENCRAMTRPA